MKLRGDCWIWPGAKSQGYGKKQDYKISKPRNVHRIIYERLNGFIPKQLYLDHLCRNRSCVNPFHLEVVSLKENIRRGSVPKLTMRKANTIRKIYQNERITLGTLAKAYGVSDVCIWYVVNNKTWV